MTICIMHGSIGGELCIKSIMNPNVRFPSTNIFTAVVCTINVLSQYSAFSIHYSVYSIANSVSRILALSSHSVRCPSVRPCTSVTSLHISIISHFRPHKPNIFWKLVTPTIQYSHCPLTHHPHRTTIPTKKPHNPPSMTISPLFDVLHYTNHIFS